jgi:integrase
LGAFPDSFGTDLALYLDSLAHPDPLDPEALASPLRPTSRTQYRSMILRFASLVVRSGVPIERIDRIAALVGPEVAERGLREMLSRTGGKSSVGISDMAHLLKSIARRFVRVGEEQQKKLGHWNARLSGPAQTGMTAKNSARLRPFDNPDVLLRLLKLPQELFNRANSKKAKKQDFLAREEAIGIAILLNCPIRRENLTEIHIEQDLQRPGDGRVYMVFDREDVKNSRLLEFDLPRSVVAMIDEHLATRSPLLCPAGTPWLFPRRDGSDHLNLTHFAERIMKRIRLETGLVMNMHLFRHLAAKIWLAEHPGQYEVVRRLLGHSNTSQTFNLYCEFEAGVATRRFSQLISKKQSG